ncbi:MAG: hypothetical protein ACU836_15340, partial [Gammaproteobacteria bacterium]
PFTDSIATRRTAEGLIELSFGKDGGFSAIYIDKHGVVSAPNGADFAQRFSNRCYFLDWLYSNV